MMDCASHFAGGEVFTTTSPFAANVNVGLPVSSSQPENSFILPSPYCWTQGTQYDPL